MNKGSEKSHVVVDVGPYTILMIAELTRIVLKVMNYIQHSWLLVLSPIVLIIASASLILLFTFLKLLKNNLF